jgi:hypothetical protein
VFVSIYQGFFQRQAKSEHLCLRKTSGQHCSRGNGLNSLLHVRNAVHLGTDPRYGLSFVWYKVLPAGARFSLEHGKLAVQVNEWPRADGRGEQRTIKFAPPYAALWANASRFCASLI